MRLKSIAPISKVYDTGTNPVRVLCDDFHEYVCKHSYRTPAYMLFTEYLCASFLNVWRLRVPEFAFVKIQPEHVPQDIITNMVQVNNFEIPCFGSRFYEFAKEVNESLTVIKESKKELNKIKNPEDLLKIALFDRWVANEDRHWNNYNLLLYPQEGGTYFIPFDQEKCFNSNMVNENQPIAQQSDQEILLSGDICQLLLRNNEHLDDWIEELERDYYVCVRDCQDQLEVIFRETPREWEIDIVAKRRIILRNIFSQEWIRDSFTNFRETCERFLR
jgi:hypothetical protein